MNDDRRGPKEGMKNSFLNAFVFSDLFLYSFFLLLGIFHIGCSCNISPCGVFCVRNEVKLKLKLLLARNNNKEIIFFQYYCFSLFCFWLSFCDFWANKIIWSSSVLSGWYPINPREIVMLLCMLMFCMFWEYLTRKNIFYGALEAWNGMTRVFWMINRIFARFSWEMCDVGLLKFRSSYLFV